MKVDVGERYEAYLDFDDNCGDVGYVYQTDTFCRCVLVDGLGHGRKAREASLLAIENIKNYQEDNRDLVDIITKIHEKLKRSRGVVIGICDLYIDTGQLSTAIIGNIKVKIIGKNNVSIIPKDGIVGYKITRPKMYTRAIHSGDTILMTSDGVKEHFQILDIRDLMNLSADEIAEGIMNRYRKESDDSSCIVIKYCR